MAEGGLRLRQREVEHRDVRHLVRGRAGVRVGARVRVRVRVTLALIITLTTCPMK